MKFRLKMDLSQFFEDERNLAYILVDPNWDQVICLQRHVQQIFDVPEVQFLTDDGIYIPPRESIDVIKINDVLRAIVPKKSKKKSKSTLSNSFGNNQADESLEISNGDKRKCDDEEGLACSTPNLLPKKKRRKIKKEENQSSIKELEESSIEALQNSNRVTSTIDSRELDKTIQENVMSEDTIKSRKRKRSRKNKQSLEDLDKDEKKNRLSSVPIPISSSTLRLSKSMSTPNNSTKHVHFSDDDGPTLVEENPRSKEDRVIYRSLVSMDCAARVIEAEEVKDTSRTPKNENVSQLKKPLIQIHEDIVLVPALPIKKNSSLPEVPIEQQEDCSVIEVDDSVLSTAGPDEDDDDDAAAGNDSCSDINVEKILPLSEELSELPNIGDVILFKMYHLSETFTPEISNYICGRCEHVDSTQKTLNCLVLDGIDQLDENTQNSDPSDESRVKSNGKLNCFQFSFNDMLDKRVFRM